MLIRTLVVRGATLLLAGALLPLGYGAETRLDQGYREMYNLNFDDAHKTFAALPDQDQERVFAIIQRCNAKAGLSS